MSGLICFGICCYHWYYLWRLLKILLSAILFP